MHCGDRQLDLKTPQVMGILNVTPDSFSDGSKLFSGSELSIEKSLRKAEQMLMEGAMIIDVGGESTRPGAVPVSVNQELDRVIPVLECLNNELDVILSVDTSTPEVMSEAGKAGAGLINDVRALQRPGALSVAVQTGLPVVLMHMRGQPQNMQIAPQYHDCVCEDVKIFLQQRIEECQKAGINKQQLIIDPGFGFGKTPEHNLRLLNRLDFFTELQLPVLVGISRKSILGKVTGRDLNGRLAGSVAAAVLAAEKGADILRVHDVAATVDALKLQQAVKLEIMN